MDGLLERLKSNPIVEVHPSDWNSRKCERLYEVGNRSIPFNLVSL